MQGDKDYSIAIEKVLPKPKAEEGINLLSRLQFEDKITESKVFFVLIAKEGVEVENIGVSKQIQPLLQ